MARADIIDLLGGRTLPELLPVEFRERFGATVLAVRSRGEPFAASLEAVKLRGKIVCKPSGHSLATAERINRYIIVQILTFCLY